MFGLLTLLIEKTFLFSPGVSAITELICDWLDNPMREGTGKCASCLPNPVMAKYSFANSPR